MLPAIARKIETRKATAGGLAGFTALPVGVGWSIIPGDMRFFWKLVSLGMAIDPQNCWFNEKKCYNTARGCS